MTSRLHPVALPRRLLLAAALLATACGPARGVTPEEFAALFKRHGFEYRDAQRPWGVPITATLSSVTVDGEVIEIDRASPLTPAGMEQVMRTFLRVHAANDVQLVGLVSGEPMGKVKVDARKVMLEPLRSDLINPPFKAFRARIPTFAYKGAEYDAHCDFHFVELEQKFYLVYFKGEGTSRLSEEPQCDVRSSKTRSYN